jgi:UDP-glucose 4-epimerase
MINDTGTVRRALDSVDVVFHLAALLHLENPPRDLYTEYTRVNVDGAQSVVQEAAQSRVKRFVYFSTVKVYGTRQRQPVLETAPTQPQTIYARTKLAGEYAVRAVTGIETVVLRLSPVYGPRLRGSWARLVNAIARNRFIPIGHLRNVHSLTHVDDVAQAALLAAQHPHAVGRIFNLVGHESPTMDAILSAIYTACGRSMPTLRVPSLLALAGASTLERGLQLFGRHSPLPVEALRQLTEDEAYSGKALSTLGFAPQVPLSSGWPVGELHG